MADVTTSDTGDDAQAPGPVTGGPDLADPEYREGVVDLLGALAYGELTAFSRLAADADLAPNLADKAAIGRQAVAEFHHFELLDERLTELGADVRAAMAPFVHAVDSFHDRTRPSGWLEGVVKAYVGDGFATDFYREVATYLDPRTRELVLEVGQDMGQAEFAVSTVRGAVERQPAVAGRLALWARRLVGEALSQAQRVAAERDALASLLIGSATRSGADLAEIGRMFARLTEAHTRRMERLGLKP
ncbi:MAG TPA: ferritin-like fold-containing protein [Actinomycetales bacterium]|nr:ferritin-like fold-containing protein [Actinomycetales bacterium]